MATATTHKGQIELIMKHALTSILAALSCSAVTACEQRIGEFDYHCYKGHPFDYMCEAQLPGPYLLVIRDSSDPRLVYEFESGGTSGAIQTDDSDLALVEVGATRRIIVAVLEGGVVYIGENGQSELSGPYTLTAAKDLAGENWPELKRVQ